MSNRDRSLFVESVTRKNVNAHIAHCAGMRAPLSNARRVNRIGNTRYALDLMRAHIYRTGREKTRPLNKKGGKTPNTAMLTFLEEYVAVE